MRVSRKTFPESLGIQNSHIRRCKESVCLLTSNCLNRQAIFVIVSKMNEPKE